MKILHIKGYNVMLDDEDFAKVIPFNWTPVIYKRGKNRKTVYFLYTYHYVDSNKIPQKELLRLHRFIMACSRNDGCVIDHKDGNTLNNTKINLRKCTHEENLRNQRIRRDNTSGYKGVSWHLSSKKWRACIQFNNKSIHIGSFVSPELAHEAYKRKASELFGKFARFE